MKIDVNLCKQIERAEAEGLRSAIEFGAKAFPKRGLAVTEVAGATLCFAGPDSPFTQAVGLGLSGTKIGARDVDSIVEFYHSRGAAARVVTTPIAAETVVNELLSHGFRAEECENALAAGLREIRALRDPRIEVCEDANVWSEHSARAFGDGAAPAEATRFVTLIMASHPIVTPLVLKEREEIVATGCFTTGRNGVAALFAASTAPHARGQGHHSALIADRLARAIESGATLVRANARIGSSSERNFRRHGFSVLYTRTTWVL